MRSIIILLLAASFATAGTPDRAAWKKAWYRARQGGGTEAWTPADFGDDLVMWLESDRSDLQEITANSVYKWTNSPPVSANFYTASGDTAARRADILADDLNGYDTLSFNGTFKSGTYSGLGDLRNCSGYSTFVVHNLYSLPNSTQAHVYYLSGAGSTRWLLGYDATRKYRVLIRRADGDGATTWTTAADQPAIVTNQWTMVSATVDFATRIANIYANGSEVDELTSATSAGSLSSDTDSTSISINAVSATLLTKYAQIITIKKGLSLAEVQKLEGWAAHRYALTDLLPADHPYKNTAPTK